MTEIHPTAIVDPAAELGEGVSVGPYSIVNRDVVLGDGCQILSHVVVDGRTEIGPNCRIYPFASIGSHPQDMKYQGEPSKLVIGANNIFREHVTVNPGTEGGGMVTSISTLLMGELCSAEIVVAPVVTVTSSPSSSSCGR